MYLGKKFKITLSANNDKRIQSIDSIETFKYLICFLQYKETKCNNILK